MKHGPGLFGMLLSQYRAAAGLSQEELAELAGLSRRGISNLERGERRLPHLATVRRLADALALADAERVKFLASARVTTDTPSSIEVTRAERNAVAAAPPPRSRGDVPGGELPEPAAEQTRTISSRGEERKLITVLVGELDSVGASLQTRDAEDIRDLLSLYHARIRADLERFGGAEPLE